MTMRLEEQPLTCPEPARAGRAQQPVPEDDGELREEITTLAGHIAAATCRFLVLLGELDARGAWAGAGILGTAHWLSYRCAMGEVAAREHVRVARALRHLPRTVEAFGAGRISYSKARAITRVATPENEQDLVDLALSAPANHVERLVRGLRTAQDIEEVRDRHARRSLSWRWAEDGSLLLSGRFAPEDGARIVQTLEDLRDRAEEEMSGAAPPPEDERDLAGAPAEPERPAKDEADTRIDPRVRSRRSLADALVELCSTAPLPDADAPRTSRPMETVVHVTLAELQQGDEPGDDAGTHRPAPEGCAPAVRRRSEPRAAPAPSALVPAALTTTPRLGDGPRLHHSVARRLACDSGIVLQVHADGVGVSGRTLDVGARIRRPGSAVVRALVARDGGCRYPGCARRRFLHAHHVRFWAHGGPTVLSNLVLLCGAHHRLLHEGGYTLGVDPRGAVTVRDRQRRLVHPVPPMGGTPAGVRGAGDGVDAWTITPRWGGEPLDLGYATNVLLEGWKVAARRRAAAADQARPSAESTAHENVEPDGRASR